MAFFVTSEMAEKGGKCPFCGKFFKPNGVGGEGSVLTPIIDNLPSSSILRYGANYHDWFYHLSYKWGSRKDADLKMFELNKNKINKECGFFQRIFYHSANYRNFLAVRVFGKKFWDKSDCFL